MVEKKLSQEINQALDKSRLIVKKKYNLTVSNAVQLIAKKIIESGENGNYVEAGVFNGSMLINVAQYLKNEKKQFNLIGIDTFEGFPSETIGHKYDNPNYFKTLLEKGWITSDHYNKAVERISSLKKNEHLDKDYFKEISNLFQIAKDFTNIQLVKTSFDKIDPNKFDEIDVLFIDCDLYQSYLDVLNKLYDKVKVNGVVIFDEYYSLKYPGAIIAVKEFFRFKNGTFETYTTSEGFNRVCFVKL